MTALRGGGPLRLTAAKARVGHAEPAAGTVGFVHVSALELCVSFLLSTNLHAPAVSTGLGKPPVQAALLKFTHGNLPIDSYEQELSQHVMPNSAHCILTFDVSTQAAAMLDGAFTSALPHIRTLNPHVASIISSAAAAVQREAAMGPTCLARGDAALWQMPHRPSWASAPLPSRYKPRPLVSCVHQQHELA